MIESTRNSGRPLTSIGPGSDNVREGYFASSLGSQGLMLEIWNVGNRLGALGMSIVIVEASW